MPDTSLGITYPSSTDHTRMWEHFQTLAQDVDTLLGRKGYVADNSRNTNSATFTTTETMLQTLTFTAVAGVRYKLVATQSVQQDAASGSVTLRLRWATGTSVTTAGTMFATIIAGCPSANIGTVSTVIGTFTASASGSVTVGVSGVRNTGTGTVLSFGSATMVNTLLVEGV